MSEVVVFNHVTLDGVMQAPGRPDEDRRGGFEHGGWAASRMDVVVGAAAAEGMARSGSLLLGRRTFEGFAAFWPKQRGNPFTDVLNNTQKYVASRTLKEPLPWSNSTLLKGDPGDAVARLKQQPGKDLVVLGSGRTRRLFSDGGALAALRLLDTKTSTTGVVIATYQSGEPT